MYYKISPEGLEAVFSSAGARRQRVILAWAIHAGLVTNVPSDVVVQRIQLDLDQDGIADVTVVVQPPDEEPVN